ncbi:insulinase family protein [Luteimonas sp. SX5]|uniref:Insulinase family protein n=1 Tax=Luteimonas galliterrae TaxID=2940486 RepID=A0ABT0MJ91_9GAMM|nr:pitrilysin family protein [Luteimonas galliterrae]MCL1634938.1 insulinase family protein [Luteimonas galliterrae]
MADVSRRENQSQMSFRIRAAWPLMVLALVGSSPGCSPATAKAGVSQDFHKVRSVGDIEEYRLQTNGLTILLARDASAPVVSFNITYRVGSRNEVTGTTGAAHLLEHLMFKGSNQHNKPDGTSLDQYLERVGAGYNASTSPDRTNYYATLGHDHLDGYIAIEADRMRHLWLREEDRSAEMAVVRNEFERGKNDPGTLLWEEVMAATYQASPYHHPTIGWRSDIEQIPIEKIRAFYDTYYWPNNATVIVVGDFETEDVLYTIGKHYGAYPRSPQPIPKIYTEEPEQSGARRVTVKRPGQLGSLMIVHKVPDARNDDHAALTVLDGILGAGKSARLYRALVDTGLALNVWSDTFGLHDSSVHILGAELAPGATHEQVERILLAEVEKIKRDGVTAAEVDRVKQQTLAKEAYRRDGTAGVAAVLSEYTAVGDWTLYRRLPSQIAKVTSADVQRMAKNWLDEDRGTTGWYVPKPNKEIGS